MVDTARLISSSTNGDTGFAGLVVGKLRGDLRMQRPIKFRARHNKDGKWFYGTNGELNSNDETTMSLSMFWHLIEVGELDRETVGQYTNGKEILENIGSN